MVIDNKVRLLLEPRRKIVEAHFTRICDFFEERCGFINPRRRVHKPDFEFFRRFGYVDSDDGRQYLDYGSLFQLLYLHDNVLLISGRKILSMLYNGAAWDNGTLDEEIRIQFKPEYDPIVREFYKTSGDVVVPIELGPSLEKGWFAGELKNQ